jgi:two-component system capsular synthesis sensor histidine kinase RcsC
LRTEKASIAKSLFLAVVSHEIRTLLYGMLASIELIGKTRLDEAQAQLSAAMACSARTLKDVLNNTLDFTRSESESIRVARQEFDLRRALEATVQAFDAQAALKGLQLHCRLDPALAGLWWGDSVKLMQILNNLLNNAVKFTAQGSVTLIGELVAEPAGAGDYAEIALAVRDTGPGIAAEDIDRIFGLFGQARYAAAPSVSGAGLGLYICRQFATAMGATIDLASTPPDGSTFTLRLALQRSGAALAGIDTSADSCASVPASGDTADTADAAVASVASALSAISRKAGQACGKEAPWVLVVDDQPINRLLLERQLRHLGCHAVTAADGAEALAGKKRFDLILTDLRLPGLDGYALARIWRAGGMDCPIVAVSAGHAAVERERCAAAGMDGYLAKPFTMDELAQLLRKHLGPRAPPRSAHPDGGWRRWEPGMMRIVVTTLASDLEALAACAANADIARLGRVVHRIHGGMALLEMRPAAALCRTIEECIEFEWLEESLQFVPALQEMLRQIRDDIDPDQAGEGGGRANSTGDAADHPV